MSKFAALEVGRVVAAHGRHFIVETPGGKRVTCHPRGKKSDCVVGDLVRWQPSGDEGVIERIEPRRNLLFRQDDWRTKSFAANLDQILVMVAGEPMRPPLTPRETASWPFGVWRQAWYSSQRFTVPGSTGP